MVIRLFVGFIFAVVMVLGQTKSTTNDIFSGTVAASGADSVTVVRKVPARPDETRIFVIDKDTAVEGHLKVNSRVSIRFSKDASGVYHALRVIVRAEVKAPVGRPTTRVR